MLHTPPTLFPPSFLNFYNDTLLLFFVIRNFYLLFEKMIQSILETATDGVISLQTLSYCKTTVEGCGCRRT